MPLPFQPVFSRHQIRASLLSDHPDQEFPLSATYDVAGHPPASVRNALTKLQPHFDKWYGGLGLPFRKSLGPNNPLSSVTPARAAQWTALRGRPRSRS